MRIPSFYLFDDVDSTPARNCKVSLDVILKRIDRFKRKHNITDNAKLFFSFPEENYSWQLELMTEDLVEEEEEE